jgi:hypothetical protein
VTSLINTQPLQDFFAVASTYDAKPPRTVSLNHLGISVLANARRCESRDTVTPKIVASAQTAGIAWTVALKLQEIFANYIESVTVMTTGFTSDFATRFGPYGGGQSPEAANKAGIPTTLTPTIARARHLRRAARFHGRATINLNWSTSFLSLLLLLGARRCQHCFR